MKQLYDLSARFKLSNRFFRVLFFISIIFCSLVQPCTAQWSADPSINTRINAGTATYGFDKAVIHTGEGYMIAWTDMRKNGDHGQIYLQYLNAKGERQWANNGKAVCTYPGEQGTFVLTPDEKGGAIIVWNDYRPEPLPTEPWTTDVYVQRINAQGELMWQADGVPVCTAGGDQAPSDIIADGEGGAYLVWTDHREFAKVFTYVQHINAEGEAQWSVNGLAVCPGFGGNWSRAILDENGNLLLTWSDDRHGGSMFAQKINPAGERLWPAEGVLIGDAPGQQYYPMIVFDGAEGAIICWLDTRIADYVSVYAQRVNSGGQILWPLDGKHVASPVNSQRVPRMISDGVGGAIITWDDRGFGDNVHDVYTQRIDATGSKKWGENGVAVSIPGNRQYWPSLVTDKAGGAIITWQDRVITDQDNNNIMAQRVDHAGNKLWSDKGLYLCNASRDQSYPWIEKDGSGGAVVVWADQRVPINDRAGIYIQNISPTGALGCLPMAIVDQPLGVQSVFRDSIPVALEVKATGQDLKYQWYSNTTATHPGAGSMGQPVSDPLFTPPSNVPGRLFYYCRIMSPCDTLYSDFSEVEVLESIPSPGLNDILEIRVLPNPAVSQFNIVVRSPEAGQFELRIIDMMGRTMFYSLGFPGEMIRPINYFAAGMYLVEVRQSGQKLVKKMIKL